MDRFESEALDRHITGNWGEDSVPPEDVPLTAGQRRALAVIYDVTGRRAQPRVRPANDSHVQGRRVNARAAESLRRLGLARFGLDYAGEYVEITATGRDLADRLEL